MNTPREWRPLAVADLQVLSEARLQLHWASQVVADVGETFAEPQTDTSQSTMVWSPRLSLLVGKPILGGQHIALDPAALVLAFIDEHGAVLGRCALAGMKLADGYAWAKARLAEIADDALALRRPGYELATHPLAEGQPFKLAPPQHFEQLARWFANADAALGPFAARERGASQVRCWPHHFDMATLVTFDEGEPDAQKARSANLGMSPGDGVVPEPYFYVGPWPQPNAEALPELDGGGRWLTDDWVGAVLRGSQLSTSAASQASQVQAFLASGLAASKTLLGVKNG